MMNAAMADAFGSTSAEGVWSQRDSFQIVHGGDKTSHWNASEVLSVAE